MVSPLLFEPSSHRCRSKPRDILRPNIQLFAVNSLLKIFCKFLNTPINLHQQGRRIFHSGIHLIRANFFGAVLYYLHLTSDQVKTYIFEINASGYTTIVKSQLFALFLKPFFLFPYHIRPRNDKRFDIL